MWLKIILIIGNIIIGILSVSMFYHLFIRYETERLNYIGLISVVSLFVLNISFVLKVWLANGFPYTKKLDLSKSIQRKDERNGEIEKKHTALKEYQTDDDTNSKYD